MRSPFFMAAPAAFMMASLVGGTSSPLTCEYTAVCVCVRARACANVFAIELRW